MFLSGQAVSLLGDGLAVMAIPLLVLGLSHNPLISGLSAASVTVGYLAVGLPAGVLIDRLDPWRVLIAMDAARAVLFAALFASSLAGLMTVWVIIFVALAAGACSVFFETALVVVVKDQFTGARLMRANSALELANQISLVLGPAVVGVLAAIGSMRAALLADALTFVISLASLAAVRRPAAGPARELSGVRWADLAQDFGQGIRYLLGVRVLVILTAVQMVVNLCLAVEKLIFYYAKDTLGLTSPYVSIVVAAGGVGGAIGALTASRLAGWIGEIRLITSAVVAAGAAICAMGAARSLAGLTAANLLYVWALVVAGLVNRTQRQRIVPRELLGRVTSTVRLLFLAVDPLGVVIAGALTAALGNDPRPVFLGAGVLVGVAAIAGWLVGLRTEASRAADAELTPPVQIAGRAPRANDGR